MKKVIMALVLLAALLVPASVSAHHATSIGVDVNCTNHTLVASVDYVQFSGGHYIELTLNGKTQDSPALNGSGTYTFAPTPFNSNGTLIASAQAKYPDGRNENEPVTTSVVVNCTPDKVTPPRASFYGPCGDPMYRWTLRAGTERAVFKINVNLYHKGWRTFTRTIAAGQTFVSKYKHITGNTKMTITSNGKVLAHEKSAAPGTYEACPR